MGSARSYKARGALGAALILGIAATALGVGVSADDTRSAGASVTSNVSSGSMISPMGASSKVTSIVGDKRGGGARPHAGIDLGAPTGSPAVAFCKLQVTHVINEGSWGWTVAGRVETTQPGWSYYFAYRHLNKPSVAAGQVLARGEKVGTLAALTSGPHLHFEFKRENSRGFDGGQTWTTFNPIAQPAALNAEFPLGRTVAAGSSWGAGRFSPAPVCGGGSNGGGSQGGGSQPVAPTPGRVAVLQPNGALLVKEGPLNATWTTVANGVEDFDLDGNRIGIRQSGNITLLVKEGPLNATWTTVANGAVDFDLDGNRIGVRAANGALSVKEGPVNATWTKVANGVATFQLAH